jgi:hypothetical protein
VNEQEQSSSGIRERYVIRHMVSKKYIHQHPSGAYILLETPGDGLIIFDKKFPAKNFKKIFIDREQLEVIPQPIE